VPSLTYSKNNNLRSLTAPAGYAEYRWGNDINGTIAGATTNVFTTDQYYTGIRCFIKDSNGNWHASQRVNLGQFSSQREQAGVDVDDLVKEDDFKWKLYPNPYLQEFAVEFLVQEDNSSVKLEILNNEGVVIKTLVDNPHAKGIWKYPVTDVGMYNGGMHYMRLKINESFMVKRILKDK
jgi:hypothetical protein